MTGVIVSVQGGKAVIKLQNGTDFLWPIADLPSECKIGSKINLYIDIISSDDNGKDELAKNFLNRFLEK